VLWQIADAGNNLQSLSNRLAATLDEWHFLCRRSRYNVKKIGKQMKTGGLTWLGSTKPDDPVFKESWSVSIQPQSSRRLSMPSGNTSNEADAEADESENVMRDPMTGEAIRCRYCNSADVCPHLLFLINWDFPGNVEGYCAKRLGQFRELVQAAFLPRLQSGTGSKWVWNIRELNELLDYARITFSDAHTTVALDGVVVSQLVIDMFDRVGGEKYSRSVENAPGPGLATVWVRLCQNSRRC
jgi:hypothetical protein